MTALGRPRTPFRPIKDGRAMMSRGSWNEVPSSKASIEAHRLRTEQVEGMIAWSLLKLKSLPSNFLEVDQISTF
jgi:hypothetical protein